MFTWLKSEIGNEIQNRIQNGDVATEFDTDYDLEAAEKIAFVTIRPNKPKVRLEEAELMLYLQDLDPASTAKNVIKLLIFYIREQRTPHMANYIMPDSTIIKISVTHPL